MNSYIRNKNCTCVRCRSHSMMGAAILITLGVLFLLENYHYVPFERSFPVLLLVIGSVLLISRTGSTEGHVDPAWYGGTVPPAPGATPQQWTTGISAPPSNDPNDPQVKP